MLQAFFSASVGAQQQMTRLGVHGNNIANVNTYGYRGEKPSFDALMYRMVRGVDEAQLPKGSGTQMVSTATDFRTASLTETGLAQDYAIIGRGFFALYDPQTETLSYTRDGSFTLSMFQQPGQEEGEDGAPVMETVYYLSDGEGRQVLDASGFPIVVTDPNAPQPVGVFDIQYQDGLEHLDGGRFLRGEKNGAVWMSGAEVKQGYLESSNTELAVELSKVIESQRAYSYALKMVTTADEVETTINNLTN